MALPRPKVALTDACSVLFNNTLYSYSADAFQSLSLTKGASWTQLTQAEKVTGGVCVGSTPADASQAAFFVVGGTGESAEYPGLSKFTYSTEKWEAVPAAGAATQNRTGHGAVYINSTDSILVYAGSLDSSTDLSTQTFSVAASSGDVFSHTASIAPPAYQPILLPWSASEAALVGGSATNMKVVLFSSEQGWMDSGTTLAEPLPKTPTAIKAMIMAGDDGSKSLYTFDMTVSPTAVNRTVLVNSVGGAIADSAPVAKRLVAAADEPDLPWTVRRRQAVRTLTLAAWPAYNSSNAPSSIMDSYSLAEDGNGMVVLTGGDGDDVVSIFSARENVWEDAAAVLGVSKSLSPTTSTDDGQTSSSSATSAAGPTAAAETSLSGTPTADKGGQNKVLLGSILGSILGAAALLAIAYFLIKRRHRKRAHLEAGHNRRASGPSIGEKNGFAFAKDSLPQPVASPTFFRGHQHQESAGSFSSLAMLIGRFNPQKTGTSSGGLNRNPSDRSRRTSADSMFNRAFKNTISKPIPRPSGTTDMPPPPRYEESETITVNEKGGGGGGGGGPVVVASNEVKLDAAPAPRPRVKPDSRVSGRQDGNTRRSSGWNRYWSGGSALNILGLGSDKQQQPTTGPSPSLPSATGTGTGTGTRNGAQISSAVASLDPAQRPTLLVSAARSQYDDLPRLRNAQDSGGGSMLPLQVYEPRAAVNRVNSASPTISHATLQPGHNGLKGQIEMSRLSGASMTSAASDGDMSASGYPSGMTAAYGDLWDPMASPSAFATPMAGGGRVASRTPSSIYSHSARTTVFAPASTSVTQLPFTSASALSSHQDEQQQRPPTGVSRQPPLATAETSDMSWLNLGEGTN